MTASTRLLVTGANGLLGANAGRNLGRASNAITSIGLNRSQAATAHFDETVRGDLTDLDSLRGAVDKVRPDVVLHAGALASHEACESDPKLARLMNVEATRTLTSSARTAGASFVYISTDAVFDGERGGYSEANTPSPFSVYGRTKLEGEFAALSEHPESLVICTNFFGWSPGGTRSILKFVVNSLQAGTSVNGFTDFSVTSIYVQHLLQALHELVMHDHTGLVHLASRDSLTKFEFGIDVADVFGLDTGLISPSTSSAVGLQTSQARNLSLNVTLCESLLGRSLPSQHEGLSAAHKDEIAWGAVS